MKLPASVGLAALIAAVARLTCVGSGAEAVVQVAAQPAQQMPYGMDFERLWSWGPGGGCPTGLREKQKLAEFAVRDCRVQYVRLAVNCAAELKEGTFDASAYDEILDMMTCMKAAHLDIKFFGSPRPLPQAIKYAPWGCFPPWISGLRYEASGKGVMKWKHGTFDPVKAADYMVRYVRFMRSKGFKISYLDLNNEIKKHRPAELAVMAKRTREEL